MFEWPEMVTCKAKREAVPEAERHGNNSRRQHQKQQIANKTNLIYYHE